ncbi:MAG: hypothetical protein U0V70_12050 [Terriglobia bacterium]
MLSPAISGDHPRQSPRNPGGLIGQRFQPGIVVFDRACRLCLVRTTDRVFVTRLRDDARYRVVEQRPLPQRTDPPMRSSSWVVSSNQIAALEVEVRLGTPLVADQSFSFRPDYGGWLTTSVGRWRPFSGRSNKIWKKLRWDQPNALKIQI